MNQEHDTIALLKECNSGIQMGVHSIEEVMGKVVSQDMRKLLESSLEEHERLGNETHDMLREYGQEVKDAHPFVKSMSDMKTNMKIAMDESDATIAEILVDGCHMGVKSLSQYLNQYKGADERAKDIAKKLISMEESLDKKLRVYL